VRALNSAIERRRFIDTPGHARHHCRIWDEASKGIISGDTLGASYREFDTDKGGLILPPTQPVQFDPVAWHKTVDKLLALQPEYTHLTHFSRMPFNTISAEKLKNSIDDFAAIALKHEDSNNRFKVTKKSLESVLIKSRHRARHHLRSSPTNVTFCRRPRYLHSRVGSLAGSTIGITP